MKLSKYILSAFFSLAFAVSANAKTINVEALGVGDDYDWAVLNAVENAVRQTSDIYIAKTVPEMKGIIKEDANIKIEDGKIISGVKKSDLKGNISGEIKTIEAYYQGKVKSYKVKKMEEKNNKVYVTIDAVVEPTPSRDDYKSPDLIVKPEYTLAVMPFKGLKSYSCGKDKIALSYLNTSIINSLNKRFSKTKKFSMVNREDLYDYAAEMELTALDLTRTKDKSKLGNLASADYLIVGTINEFQSYTNKKTIDITGESYTKSSSRIAVDYNIIETATMEIIFADTASASLKKEGGQVSCEKTLRKLTDELSEEITKDAMKAIFPSYEYSVEKVLEKSEGKSSSKTTKTTSTKTTTQKREVVKLPFDK